MLQNPLLGCDEIAYFYHERQISNAKHNNSENSSSSCGNKFDHEIGQKSMSRLVANGKGLSQNAYQISMPYY